MMFGSTISSAPPPPSRSKYVCTLTTVLLSGSCSAAHPSAFDTLGFAVSYQEPLHEEGWLKPLPGTMIMFVAPVARMASIAACAAANHCVVDMAWGSFISPKTTFELPPYDSARRRQRSANALFGTAAEPTTSLL